MPQQNDAVVPSDVLDAIRGRTAEAETDIVERLSELNDRAQAHDAFRKMDPAAIDRAFASLDNPA